MKGEPNPGLLGVSMLAAGLLIGSAITTYGIGNQTLSAPDPVEITISQQTANNLSIALAVTGKEEATIVISQDQFDHWRNYELEHAGDRVALTDLRIEQRQEMVILAYQRNVNPELLR